MLVSLFLVMAFFGDAPVLGDDPAIGPAPDLKFLEINDEIKDYVKGHVLEGTQKTDRKRLFDLIEAVFDENRLNLTYDNARTRSAQETFETGNGNCMSFTTLFVAMARHAGLQAEFQEVRMPPTWDRRNDIIVNNKHINVRVIIDGRVHDVDFYPYRDKRWNFATKIDDSRAQAHFYNNIGAEFFSQGNIEVAGRYFQRAVQLSKDMPGAWSNLGVFYRRIGRLALAEACYKRALSYNPEEYTAIVNLAMLAELRNDKDQARKYERKAQRFRDRNPYYHVDMAEAALAQNDFNTALKHYRRATNLKPQESEFYLGLARTYYAKGDANKAAHFMRRARHFAVDDAERQRYSRKLDLLLAHN